MEEQLYTPQEIADMLKIKKTTVYEMIKKGSLNATKMGKQFRISETALKSFISKGNKEKGDADPDLAKQRINTNAYYDDRYVVCGQDIVLDMLCSAANSQLGRNCFLRSYAGSYHGLLALYNEEISVASAHLWDKNTNTYNIPFMNALLPGVDVSVYHVMNRPICIYTALGNPKEITSVKDFAREDVAIVNREKGSGIRVLTDSLLSQENISVENINGYGRTVNSHLAAASIIARGGADCAVGTENAACQFRNIERIFLKNEQYDIVLLKSDEKIPQIKLLIELLQSERFHEEVSAIGFYDTTDMGKKLM